MLFWCFAWLVWLLCACGVRRFKGLWRVCLRFSCFSSSLPSFSSLYLLFVLHLVCFVLVVFLLSSCIVFVALWVCCGFSFSLSDYTQKERARRVGASSLVLLWACLDVLKHYRYLLRFVVPMSFPFTENSCNLFGMLRCVFSFLPVFIYH